VGRTASFGERLDVEVGPRTVELLRLGPAHSSTDIAARIVDAGVLVVGDVVTLPYPAAADGFSSIRGWKAALEHILASDFRTLVPGHGAVQHDRTYVQDLLRLVSDIEAQVGRAVERGDTSEVIAEGLDVAWWTERHLGDDPRLQAGFSALFLSPAVQILTKAR